MLKHLARVKVDERIVKILAAIDFSAELGQIAARGARYGFPGWPQETQTKGGKAKTEYLSSVDAGRKAREFLAGASAPADVAGRLTALAVMAHYAKEDCVAQSARSFYALRMGGHGGLPWAGEVIGLIEQVAEERLPEHLTAHVRDEREGQAEAIKAEQAAVEAANALRGRLDELNGEERLEALRAFEEQHGRHTVVVHWLHQDILRRNAQDRRANDQTGEPRSPDVENATTAESDVVDADATEPSPAEQDGTDGHGEAGEELAAAV